ncbi:MAG: hypothetical protein MdMp024_1080 [Bacteroidales bacterium]
MSILVSIFKENFRHAGNMPPAMMCDRIQSGFYANVITPLREVIAQGDLELAERCNMGATASTQPTLVYGQICKSDTIEFDAVCLMLLLPKAIQNKGKEPDNLLTAGKSFAPAFRQKRFCLPKKMRILQRFFAKCTTGLYI